MAISPPIRMSAPVRGTPFCSATFPITRMSPPWQMARLGNLLNYADPDPACAFGAEASRRRSVHYASLSVGAQVEQDAFLAPRVLGPADGSPVRDHRDVQVITTSRRNPRPEQPVCLVRGRAGRDPAESQRHPVHVGVDRERRPPHREREYARGRLRPHAGERNQVAFDGFVIEVMESVEIDAAFLLLDGRENLLNPARLLVGDAAAADGVRDLVNRSVSYLLPAREPVLQPRERTLGVRVGGVLRQDRGDQLIDDRQRRLGDERALVLPQPALHRLAFSHGPPLRSASMIGCCRGWQGLIYLLPAVAGTDLLCRVSGPLVIPRIALGCGNFGGVGSAPDFFGQGLNQDAALELMDAAWELGITHFDTADAYGGGAREGTGRRGGRAPRLPP